MSQPVFVVGGSQIVVASWNTAWQQAFNYLALSAGLLIISAILGNRWRQFALFFNPRPSSVYWRCNICLNLTFLVSFCFVYIAGFLQFGVGLSISTNICSSAIILCVSAYTLTKITTYLFLLERVYIVSGQDCYLKCKEWLIGAAIFLCGIPILVGFILSREHKVEHAMCHIGISGLKGVSAWMLVAWDLILNITLSLTFAIKLRGTAMNSRSPLRRLAQQTFFCTAVSATTSLINIAVLTGLQFEAGWLCLALCNTDVLVDAIALSILTNSRDTDSQTPVSTSMRQQKFDDLPRNSRRSKFGLPRFGFFRNKNSSQYPSKRSGNSHIAVSIDIETQEDIDQRSCESTPIDGKKELAFGDRRVTFHDQSSKTAKSSVSISKEEEF